MSRLESRLRVLPDIPRRAPQATRQVAGSERPGAHEARSESGGPVEPRLPCGIDGAPIDRKDGAPVTVIEHSRQGVEQAQVELRREVGAAGRAQRGETGLSPDGLHREDRRDFGRPRGDAITREVRLVFEPPYVLLEAMDPGVAQCGA